MSAPDPIPGDHVLARSADIPEGGRLVVEVGGMQVGVFRVGGVLRAYENRCAHQGGPVCQGRIVPRVEENLDEGRASRGYRFSTTATHIVCPWHGYEYDLATGVHPGGTAALRSFPVTEWNGEVRVRL